jgi:VanZ family protein
MLLVSLWMLFSPGSTVPSGPPYSDKVVHFLLFALLVLTAHWGRLPLRRVAIALAAYAAVSEVLQAVLPIHRNGDVSDALVDVAGIALGLFWCRPRVRA